MINEFNIRDAEKKNVLLIIDGRTYYMIIGMLAEKGLKLNEKLVIQQKDNMAFWKELKKFNTR